MNKNHTGHKHNKKGDHCICCMSPKLQQELIQEHIDQIGFTVIPIIDSNPSYAFTVGLTETLGCPELLLLCDMDVKTLGQNLAIFGTRLIQHCVRENPDKNQDYIDSIFKNADCPFLMTLKTENGSQLSFLGLRMINDKILSSTKKSMMGSAIARYGLDGFRVAQVILPDARGKLSWHVGFDKHWGISSGQIPMYKFDKCDLHPIIVDECAACKITLPYLKKCSRCKEVLYCTEKCQKKHWTAHRPFCKIISLAAEINSLVSNNINDVHSKIPPNLIIIPYHDDVD